MAIPTGSGTEGIRSVLFDTVSDQNQALITGVRYHIYTVLSIVIHNAKAGTSSSSAYVYLIGYDVRASASQAAVQLFDIPAMAQGETFVWNDKFSFYGCENDVSQSTTTAQILRLTNGNSQDIFDGVVTYIDQDWT